jgi:hypothetical protein
MTISSTHRLRRSAPLAIALVCLAPVAGCEKRGIRAYMAPKDRPPEALAPDVPPAPEPERPQLAWTLPAGWAQAQAGQMSVASFAVADAQGGANITITPLPNLAGREEAVINMWREQVELGPLQSDEVARALTPTVVAGAQGQAFEIAGSRGGKPTRTVTAILHRGAESWFFKMSGDDATVIAQKPAFFEFVKTIQFIEGAPAAAQKPAAPAAAPHAHGEHKHFHWEVPRGWTAAAPGPMQEAKFSVPEVDGAKAEVTISVFPSDTGGTLANVNRWRQQIGLEPIQADALGQFVSPLDGSPDAVFVDLSSETRRMLGAIVPRGGRYWFYKLMGDSPAVAAAREDFRRFAQSEP